jgi:hypothetical protein
LEGGVHECSAESVSALGGCDVELCEVALAATAPDRVTKAENRQPVGVVADEEDDGVVALEQSGDSVLEFGDWGCRFVELAVEVVEQLCDDARVAIVARRTGGASGRSMLGEASCLGRCSHLLT